IVDMSPHTRLVIAIATLIYAALFFVEGIGLLLDKLWAEYLTTIITTSFVPIEIYEVIEHASMAKAAVTVVNIGVVIYLVWRLRRDGHWPFRKHAASAA